jgi:aminoglycoside phosphotransferase (APT) family kinase protein
VTSNESPPQRPGRLIGQGLRAEVYEWGDREVVKLFLGDVPASDIEHEIRMATALARLDVPAPRYRQLVHMEDRAGLVFERIEGPSMLAVLSSQPWRVIGLARRLADLHAAVHRVTTGDNRIPGQRDALRSAIEGVVDLPESLRSRALQVLDVLPDGDRLCHGDFHPDNVLLATGGEVVIDWITCMRGSPAADVARTLVMLRFGAPPPRAPRSTLIAATLLRRLFVSVYWRRYRRRTGIHPDEVAAWHVPVVAARLRESLPASERARLFAELSQK